MKRLGECLSLVVALIGYSQKQTKMLITPASTRFHQTVVRLSKGMSTVDHKSHNSCFYVFLTEAGVMNFVTNCFTVEKNTCLR